MSVRSNVAAGIDEHEREIIFNPRPGERILKDARLHFTHGREKVTAVAGQAAAERAVVVNLGCLNFRRCIDGGIQHRQPEKHHA